MIQNNMELLAIAIALSMDAVAISIIIGAQDREIKGIPLLTVALFFGFFQALMPLLGYYGASCFSDALDHYSNIVAFAILLYLGIAMVREARQRDVEESLSHTSHKELFVLAIATSIDALAAGVTFSFQSIPIVNAVTVIGVTTFVLSLAGVYIGKKLGTYLHDKAEYFGGTILIILGIKMLIG